MEEVVGAVAHRADEERDARMHPGPGQEPHHHLTEGARPLHSLSLNGRALSQFTDSCLSLGGGHGAEPEGADVTEVLQVRLALQLGDRRGEGVDLAEVRFYYTRYVNTSSKYVSCSRTSIQCEYVNESTI